MGCFSVKRQATTNQGVRAVTAWKRHTSAKTLDQDITRFENPCKRSMSGPLGVQSASQAPRRQSPALRPGS